MRTTDGLHSAFVGAALDRVFTPARVLAYALGMKAIATAIIAIGLCFAATGARAQTLETGKPGLVVKNLKCDAQAFFSTLTFNVSNRSDRSVSGRVSIVLLDRENDPVDSVAVEVSIDGNSGEFFNSTVSKCYGGGYCLAPMFWAIFG